MPRPTHPKLRTHVKFEYLYLYVILDIFSRYVVGWLLAEHENAQLAERLIQETCDKHGVTPGYLHADRGAPMKSKLLIQLLANLDVSRSHSRPHVSNDNPFSESQFKTLKYHPSFPDRFGGIDDGLIFCRSFFPWYNDEHHHSGIAYLTPREVHYGKADDVLRLRHEVLMASYDRHPERFVRGPPRLPSLARAVYINPPSEPSGTAPVMPHEGPARAGVPSKAQPPDHRVSATTSSFTPQTTGAFAQ
jgi:putative transposase